MLSKYHFVVLFALLSLPTQAPSFYQVGDVKSDEVMDILVSIDIIGSVREDLEFLKTVQKKKRAQLLGQRKLLIQQEQRLSPSPGPQQQEPDASPSGSTVALNFLFSSCAVFDVTNEAFLTAAETWG